MKLLFSLLEEIGIRRKFKLMITCLFLWVESDGQKKRSRNFTKYGVWRSISKLGMHEIEIEKLIYSDKRIEGGLSWQRRKAFFSFSFFFYPSNPWSFYFSLVLSFTNSMPMLNYTVQVFVLFYCIFVKGNVSWHG